VILRSPTHIAAAGRHAVAHMSPQVYRLIIDGEIGPRYASAFEGMTVSSGAGKTEIIGAVIDQSQLQGLLGRISGLGLTLHSVTPMPEERQ
jgi:hypothetical protein